MRKITYFLNEGDRNRLLNEDSTIFFEFKEVIDIYCVTDKARGLKEHAIYGNASGGSCFLLKMQNLGHTSLSTITDEEHSRLKEYSEKHQKTITETIKEGIGLMYDTSTALNK